MHLTFRPCGPEDLESLRAFSHKTFEETFARTNSPASIKDYLEKAFHTERLRGELANPGSLFYFLNADGVLAGYLKLNEAPAQTDVHDAKSLEIERIYVAKEYQGRGLGGVLMDKALEEARLRGKSYLWLGVWEKNEKALSFYRAKGFYPIGAHTFWMGDEAQTDFMMKKDL